MARESREKIWTLSQIGLALEAYRGAAPLIGSAVRPSIETVAVLVGTRQKCLLQHWYTNFPELRQTGAVDWCPCRHEAWLAHTQRQMANAAQNQWGSLLDDRWRWWRTSQAQVPCAKGSHTAGDRLRFDSCGQRRPQACRKPGPDRKTFGQEQCVANVLRS